MKKVLLLLADGFETFEASVFIDVIGWNLVEGDKSTELLMEHLTTKNNADKVRQLMGFDEKKY